MVSFLFADVEGSTRLWEQDRRAMAASLQLHDSILRDVVARSGGYVFSTAGDSFSVAFATPHEAVAAAVEAQTELAKADWPGPAIRVRMGIHTGDAEVRDGDYFGPVLNRAARLETAGSGGQILVSAATAELLRSDLPAGVTLLDLGVHRLRDLDLPEHVYQVFHPDIPQVHTTIRTFSAPRHNLPAAWTSFVGRDGELGELAELAREHRLVTIAGAGGGGKTRLAVEYGRSVIDEHPDGVWFVELAPVVGDAVFTACAEVLGVRAGDGVFSTRQALVRSIADKRMLLLVDNCEHVAGTVADLVRDLLSASPASRIITTSRVSLHVSGEATLRIGSLATEVNGDARHTPAVKLFLDRARAIRPDFAPGGSELDAVVEVCRRVDGIPLGLELAAARLRSLSVAQLAVRLEDSFRILGGPDAGRHSTLSATIESSYDSLNPHEQLVFRRLSVFSGGFELEAAEAVGAGGVVDEFGILDHLDALVDHSLVTVEHRGAMANRYRMLEPIREYAHERLAAEGEDGDVASAHAAYFRSLVQEAAPALRGPKQAEWDDRLTREDGNVGAMLATLLDRGDVEDYLDACFDLQHHWEHRGLHVDGVGFVERGLAALDESGLEIDPVVEAKALAAAGLLGTTVMHPRAVEFARRGYERARTAGDPGVEARLSIVLGSCETHATGVTEFVGACAVIEGVRLLEDHAGGRWWEPDWDEAFWSLLIGAYLPPGHPDASAFQERAIDRGRASGDVALTALALVTVGLQSDPGLVRERLEEAIELSRSYGFRSHLALALLYLGGVRRKAGEPDVAIELLSEAIEMLADFGGHQSAAVGRSLLAVSLAQQSDVEACRDHLRFVIADDPPQAVTGHVLFGATCLALAIADHDAAARFRGGVETHLASNFLTRVELDERMGDGVPDMERLNSEGARWSSSEAFARVDQWLAALAL